MPIDSPKLTPISRSQELLNDRREDVVSLAVTSMDRNLADALELAQNGGSTQIQAGDINTPYLTKVYQLNTGKRVIAESEMFKPDQNGGVRPLRRDTIYGARDWLSTVYYSSGQVAIGAYDAQFDRYLDAGNKDHLNALSDLMVRITVK